MTGCGRELPGYRRELGRLFPWVENKQGIGIWEMGLVKKRTEITFLLDLIPVFFSLITNFTR